MLENEKNPSSHTEHNGPVKPAAHRVAAPPDTFPALSSDSWLGTLPLVAGRAEVGADLLLSMPLSNPAADVFIAVFAGAAVVPAGSAGVAAVPAVAGGSALPALLISVLLLKSVLLLLLLLLLAFLSPRHAF